jgi:DNA-binding HxlR family transcriptional regulator
MVVDYRLLAKGSLGREFMLSFRQLVSVGLPTGEARVTVRLQTRDLVESAISVGCPVARTAEIIGNKWTPLIVRDLARGRRRFSELERSLSGISPKTLSERLKRLEEAGVVDRACFAEVPPRVEYSLTPKGYDLLPVIESMRAFGSRWLGPDSCCDQDEAL